MSKYRIVEVIDKQGYKEYRAQVLWLFIWINLRNPNVTHTYSLWHDSPESAGITIKVHQRRKTKAKVIKLK